MSVSFHKFIFTLIRYRLRDISTFVIGTDIAMNTQRRCGCLLVHYCHWYQYLLCIALYIRAFNMINKERRKYNKQNIIIHNTTKNFYVFIFDIYAFTCIIDHFEFFKGFISKYQVPTLILHYSKQHNYNEGYCQC